MFGTGTSLKNGGVKQFLNIQCRFSCDIEMQFCIYKDESVHKNLHFLAVLASLTQLFLYADICISHSL
jgi:hypothetical protein